VTVERPLPDLRQLRRSPLQDRGVALAAVGDTAPGNTLAIAEIPFLSAVNLRARAGGAATDRIADRLGLRLPAVPNTATTMTDRAALWLGPDEWLVTGPDGDAPKLRSSLEEALGDEHGSVVDVSANRTTLELSGTAARELLQKGCTLDLHPRSFAAGRCAQTTCARAQVLLWQVSDLPAYRLMVRGSFAAYLADWLLDAAQEYLLEPGPR